MAKSPRRAAIRSCEDVLRRIRDNLTIAIPRLERRPQADAALACDRTAQRLHDAPLRYGNDQRLRSIACIEDARSVGSFQLEKTLESGMQRANGSRENHCGPKLSGLWYTLFSGFVLLPQLANAQTTNATGPAASLLSGMPIAAAILAAVAAYGFNIRLEKRKAELKFVSDQLQYLYGPVMALSQAADQAWMKFRQTCRPHGPFFDPSAPPTEEELEQWRLWMSEVFMPINLRMENVIIDNSHLLNTTTMPEYFQSLLAHIATYRAVIKKWPEIPVDMKAPFTEIVSQNTAGLNFPDALDTEVGKAFNILKIRQSQLIGSSVLVK